MRTRRDRSAGVIVYQRGDAGCRFLLLRSSQTKRPLWEFPKGAVDPGETPFDAALRELREETGIRPDEIHLVAGFERQEEYRFAAREGERQVTIRKQVTYYLAETGRTKITLSPAEANRFEWFPLEAALRKVRFKARRELLREAAALAGCGET